MTENCTYGTTYENCDHSPNAGDIVAIPAEKASPWISGEEWMFAGVVKEIFDNGRMIRVTTGHGDEMIATAVERSALLGVGVRSSQTGLRPNVPG